MVKDNKADHKGHRVVHEFTFTADLKKEDITWKKASRRRLRTEFGGDLLPVFKN